MDILLLEDEAYIAESLMKLVRELEPGAQIYGSLDTVAEAEKFLAERNFDLIISDIQLADGISLDLFSHKNIQCPIIFTTAYDEYAVRAFKVNSLDYLLKPVDKEELKAALDKFHLLKSKYSNPLYLNQLEHLFRDFKGSPAYKQRFAVHKGKEIVLIPAEEVAGFCKEEVIYLQATDNKKYITDYRSLDEVGELLNPDEFYRANRQHIVALKCISSIHSDESGRIHIRLKPETFADVVVSKDKAAAFRKWLEV